MDKTERFLGTERLYGGAQLARLQRSHLVVVGLGGVGSWAAEALARTAVGQLTLIDLDDICVTNTNRQLHTSMSTLGKLKTTVMAERLRAINPACEVVAAADFVTPANVAQLIPGDAAGVLDAIDSVRSKAALIAHCRRLVIPIVTTGGAGGRTDPTGVQIADLADTKRDALAARTRSLLRKDYQFPRGGAGKFGISCVFSQQPLVYAQADGSVCATKPTESQLGRLDCASSFGSSAMVTATFGMAAAAELVKQLLSRT